MHQGKRSGFSLKDYDDVDDENDDNVYDEVDDNDDGHLRLVVCIKESTWIFPINMMMMMVMMKLECLNGNGCGSKPGGRIGDIKEHVYKWLWTR